MNNNQKASKQSPLRQVRNLIRNNLVVTITATVAGSLLLTGVSTWNIWSIYNSFQSTITKQIELQKVSDDMVYQDEVLTMSARMLVSTGDLQWETRYNQFVPTFDVLLKKFLANISTELRTEANRTGGASAKLFAFEDKAFKLVKQGKQKEAFQILMGTEYDTQKKIQGNGFNAVLAKVEKSIQAELDNYQQQLLIAIIFAGVTLPILLVSWSLLLSAMRDYIRYKQIAQIEIEKSQYNLQHLNQVLELESQSRQQQEVIVRQERDSLQQDIRELLDVVCEIEAGDFTVNAKVHERATGLIGDVLNRLVERLGLVFSRVSIEAQQVAE
jgi:methyl-accepting chemotaxis protein PixJ